MQKQNSGLEDFTTNIADIKAEVKDLLVCIENNDAFQTILESQSDFVAEDKYEQEYYESIKWLVQIARKAAILSLVAARAIKDKEKCDIVHATAEDIYEELYEPKRPKLWVVK